MGLECKKSSGKHVSVAIHYELSNSQHIMNAQVEAKGTLAFVEAVNFISKVIGVEQTVTTKSLENGSVLRLLSFVFHDSTKMPESVKVFFINFVIRFFFSTVPMSVDSIIDESFDSKDEFDIETVNRFFSKERLKILNDNKKRILLRNAFFNSLIKDDLLQALTVKTGYDFVCEAQKVYINRHNFKDYVFKLQPEKCVVDEVDIIVTKPVLEKNSSKMWQGVYNDMHMSFAMIDSEFKTRVEQSVIAFRTGMVIRCKMQFTKEINDVGLEKLNNFKIVSVYSFSDDQGVSLTAKGELLKRSPKLPI